MQNRFFDNEAGLKTTLAGKVTLGARLAANKDQKSAYLGQRSQKNINRRFCKVPDGAKLVRVTRSCKGTKAPIARPGFVPSCLRARPTAGPIKRTATLHPPGHQNRLSYTRRDDLNCADDNESCPLAWAICGNPAADRDRRAGIYIDSPGPAPCRTPPWPRRAAPGSCTARSPPGSASWQRPGRP